MRPIDQRVSERFQRNSERIIRASERFDCGSLRNCVHDKLPGNFKTFRTDYRPALLLRAQRAAIRKLNQPTAQQPEPEKMMGEFYASAHSRRGNSGSALTKITALIITLKKQDGYKCNSSQAQRAGGFRESRQFINNVPHQKAQGVAPCTRPSGETQTRADATTGPFHG